MTIQAWAMEICGDIVLIGLGMLLALGIRGIIRIVWHDYKRWRR